MQPNQSGAQQGNKRTATQQLQPNTSKRRAVAASKDGTLAVLSRRPLGYSSSSSSSSEDSSSSSSSSSEESDDKEEEDPVDDELSEAPEDDSDDELSEMSEDEVPQDESSIHESESSDDNRPLLPLGRRARRHEPSEASANKEIIGEQSFDQDTADLLDRVATVVDYARTHSAEAITATTNFTIQLADPPMDENMQQARGLLRDAHANGYVDLIYRSENEKRYSLKWLAEEHRKHMIDKGIDAHWWYAKTRAAIKAGPLADEKQIKKFEATAKGLETKRKKKGYQPSKAQIEIADKLEEGLRRQEAGEQMYDEDEEEEDDKVEDENLMDWE